METPVERNICLAEHSTIGKCVVEIRAYSWPVTPDYPDGPRIIAAKLEVEDRRMAG